MNIYKVREKLKDNHLDALLVSSSFNIGYLTGFFGFSKTEREGYLLITKNNVYIFASGLNSEAVAKHLKSLLVQLEQTRFEIARQTGTTLIRLVEISPRTPLTKKALASIIQKEKIKKLGFEKYNLLYSEYEKLQTDLTTELVATEHLIEELRMIKSPGEIANIEKACALGDKAFEYILTRIKAGITEKELAFELEIFIRKKGAKLSFPTIVGFGPNSSVPHHITNDQRLMTNSWILLDFGVEVNEYCSDMTRTVFFGKASVEQKKMYHTVLESQQKAFALLLKDGPLSRSVHAAKDIDNIAREHIISQGYPTIPHSVGHGIGLEMHEPPRLSIKSKDALNLNMVFSIEPGIYIPEKGGVRIEDLVIMEKAGPRWLTKSRRDFIEI